MPRQQKMITSWSNSRYNTYEQCPRKAKYQFLDKLPTKGGAPLRRGSDIHSLCEHIIKGDLHFGMATEEVDKLMKKLKDPNNDFERFNEEAELVEMHPFKDELEQLAELYAEKGTILVDPEAKWGFTKDWTSCDYFDWQRCRLRVVVDCFVLNQETNVATVIDFKTGKIRSGYEPQLELYAAAAMAKYPQVEEVYTEFWFIDQGQIIGGDSETALKGVYTHTDLNPLIKKWNKRTKPMLNDQRFAPKPGPLCKWCDFSKANGGPCEY